MAAATTTTTTKLIQVRPNHRCLSTFRLFSSSSSTPTPPPPDTDDIKPPPEPKCSIPQFSSYFSDVKATLNQSQSQPQMNPSFRPPAPISSLSPPPKLPSLDEIGKTLRGFRHHTVPSSHPGPQPPSSFSQISFQDNLQRSVVNSRSLGGSSLLNDEKPRTPNLNYSSIRESFNQLKLTTVNNPKLNKSMSEYQQSLKSRPPYGGIDSNNIVTDSLPFSVFGKETGNAEDDNPAMRTEFVRYYSVKELGDNLKSLRPEKKKGDNKDWFSLDKLNERLANLRQMEMEKDKTNVSTKHFKDLKFVLSEMKLQEHDKAKRESNTPRTNNIEILRFDLEQIAGEKGIGGNLDLGRVEADSVEGPEAEAEGVDEDNDEPQGKSRSQVWDHMEVVTLPGGVQKNKCIHCKKLLSVQKNGTTTHLLRHLKDACPFKDKYFPKPIKDVAASHGLRQTQLHGVVSEEGKTQKQQSEEQETMREVPSQAVNTTKQSKSSGSGKPPVNKSQKKSRRT